MNDNDNATKLIRTQLENEKIFMLNIMSSPGSGKTSLIVSTLRKLLKIYRINVIEGDIDSIVDSEKIVQNGGHAVQEYQLKMLLNNWISWRKRVLSTVYILKTNLQNI